MYKNYQKRICDLSAWKKNSQAFAPQKYLNKAGSIAKRCVFHVRAQHTKCVMHTRTYTEIL